ncbi:hypothetical protein [Mycolicibacterium fortuitum]|uniref:hypothetical protein n=1 Tax=Mycolicibacterium fortuitum TaxID=1766 RepID=UPI0026202B5A|nr:hypothetical protein [Mycolicibacterium fortuitum]
MSHATGVVAHIDRAETACHLIETVHAIHARIDDGTIGCEANHRRVWEGVHAWATHCGHAWCVVLEDDAVPVPGFNGHLTAALAHAPSPIVSLYLGKGRPGHAQRPIRNLVDAGTDTPWITAPTLLHAVGVAIRTEHVPAMLDHIAQPPAVFEPIDQAIGHWARHGVRQPVAYTWPSLVNHADGPTVIDTHPDGKPRDTWVGDDGRVIVQRRVAWRAGTRTRWTSDHTALVLPDALG